MYCERLMSVSVFVTHCIQKQLQAENERTFIPKTQNRIELHYKVTLGPRLLSCVCVLYSLRK